MPEVQSLKGVGENTASLLKKLNIKSVEELIDYVPRRYDDYSKLIRVSQIRPGPVTIKVKLGALKARYSKRGLHITEATASDETGSVKIIWFNQPYRAKAIKLDEQYFVSGEFAGNYKFLAITNPACELVSSFPVNTARLVPHYRLTKGLGQTQLRKAVKSALLTNRAVETLPNWLLAQENLIDRHNALMQMHFPTTLENLKKAQVRLGFEEVFSLSLASELNRQEFKNEHSYNIAFNQELVKKFVDSLKFKLTNDQRKVAWQIFKDMESDAPMNRLLEGDVGSGKTVVAVLAVLGAMQAGYQVAFMAPTEILANQHAINLKLMLKNVGYDDKLLLLTGSMLTKQKELAREAIESGKARIVVGTHAVIQQSIKFKKLGLLIIDEQHRFGVEQRKALQAKAKKMPHVLNMTATPIPRSLALTLYGEMDVSVIAELPPGRKIVETDIWVLENRERVYREVALELDKGRQAFVVCPQIEETDLSNISVKKVYDDVSKKYLKKYSIGLLHGKMKSSDKDKLMQDFINKKFDVLVSTTVIEVGVDIKNASVMVIEGAERFGLAQLHQLRGRVGRGSDESACHLIMSDNSEPSTRLKLLAHESNGFKLAEYDLNMRGPGAIYGTMQHGALDLKVAKLTDVKLIERARNAAKEFVKKGENLLKYTQLKARVDSLRSITNLN